MGKAKQNEAKVFELTEHEWSYLKILSQTLAFHIFKDKIITGFLYEVAQARFSFGSDVNLQFEADLDKDAREIKITVIPAEG